MRISRLPPPGLCLLMIFTAAGAASAGGTPASLPNPRPQSKQAREDTANAKGAARAPYELHIDFTHEPPQEEVVWFTEGTGPLATGKKVTAEQRRVFLEVFRQVELPRLAPLSEALTFFPPQEE